AWLDGNANQENTADARYGVGLIDESLSARRADGSARAQAALQPVMRLLHERLRLPGALAALLLIIAVFGAIAAVGFTISVPASGWIQKAPGRSLALSCARDSWWRRSKNRRSGREGILFTPPEANSEAPAITALRRPKGCRARFFTLSKRKGLPHLFRLKTTAPTRPSQIA